MDVLILSPFSPFMPLDGGQMAVLSDVNAVLDSGLSLALVAFTYDGENPFFVSEYPAKLISARRGGGASRFFHGLLKGMAPSLERLYTTEAAVQIRAALKQWMPSVVLMADGSVAGYIPLVREIVPSAKIVLRSQNVMQDVRNAQLASTLGLLRPAIKFDCENYIAFERQAVASCDEHWAITQKDADRMVELYQRPCGHLSVSLALDRYLQLPVDVGRRNGFVHVGTIDFRRRSDLESFVQGQWPQIIKAEPAATLTLAGKLYGRAISGTDVTCLGRVKDDADIYRSGRFALNFQRSTGGIKLKTLTALAAGRVLISTPCGVEGVPIISGQHYWDMNTLLSSPNLSHVLRDEPSLKLLGLAGREYVVAKHSRGAIARQFQGLLASGISDRPKPQRSQQPAPPEGALVVADN
jgi:hypothetical protein